MEEDSVNLCLPHTCTDKCVPTDIYPHTCKHIYMHTCVSTCTCLFPTQAHPYIMKHTNAYA